MRANAFQLSCPMWWVFNHSPTRQKYDEIIWWIGLPFERFPFDWRNPLGFFIAISIQYTVATHLLAICACVMNLAVGSFLYAIGLCDFIKGYLLSINQNARARADPSILLEQLTEFLEMHSSLKQLSEHTLRNLFCLVYQTIYHFQGDQNFFGYSSTHYDDGVYMESGDNLRSLAIDSKRNSLVLQFAYLVLFWM